jgi:hypothetical protein
MKKRSTSSTLSEGTNGRTHQPLYELRLASEPLSSRELAVLLHHVRGKDCRLVLDVIKRVGKSLRVLRDKGIISGGRDRKRRYVWRQTRLKSLT